MFGLGNCKNSEAKKVVHTYESGLVQRYHTHPRLARAGRNLGHHQWGVAVLLLALHPKPELHLLREYLVHDTGERFTVDLPSPVKQLDPKPVMDLYDVIENAFNMKGFEEG